MCAAQQVRLSSQGQRILEHRGDALGHKAGIHALGPLKASVLHGTQVSSQGRMGLIKAQAHQVEGLATPSDGDFHARDKANAVVERRGLGLGQAIQGVVVGERHEAQAIGPPAGGQFGGCHHTVGGGGVHVEIDIDIVRNHLAIVSDSAPIV